MVGRYVTLYRYLPAKAHPIKYVAQLVAERVRRLKACEAPRNCVGLEMEGRRIKVIKGRFRIWVWILFIACLLWWLSAHPAGDVRLRLEQQDDALPPFPHANELKRFFGWAGGYYLRVVLQTEAITEESYQAWEGQLKRTGWLGGHLREAGYIEYRRGSWGLQVYLWPHNRVVLQLANLDK